MAIKNIFNSIHKGLVVSCQALEGEPLNGSAVMGKMARAAEMGGAAAIRANGVQDILCIKSTVHLPIIGLIKQEYDGSDVYITPTKREVDLLLEADADMIALDATRRQRPNNEQLKDLINQIKKGGALVMADISTLQEGLLAQNLGADCVSTTLSGYTSYSRQLKEPDFTLIRELKEVLSIPVIAEGRISTPKEAKQALEAGAYSVVVGSAITRPQDITKRFVQFIEKDVEKHASYTESKTS
ncbi:N-acetylmannosamine-6-phosphate 2-epimerase [Fictibacillus barbaricus]|uniref:N-acetylmannosamine-6-phosphate 2-epimerase n=1 Tax=Fictibacillus barbaricus TaxID=182136 RepID=UPI0019AB0A85|nr:N-acetylmannosamine-6-phosphate 2-epimerase [Fictibacillus barbaricus]GGB42644.1 putative N-acetylmannosamine-6-phosphate 2-epimerase [Fictibacillus barbaricus]